MVGAERALEEINAIETLIKPYRYESYDARRVLDELSALREALSSMDVESIRGFIEKILRLEAQAEYYRGYPVVEEALKHARRLREELKKLVGE